MIIKNGTVFCDDLIFRKKDILVYDNIIQKIEDNITSSSIDIYDATNMYVIPGLVDIHSHGAVGYDFSDGSVEGLLQILEFEKKHGITTYCPTSMTLSVDELKKAFKSIKQNSNRSEKKYARIGGINMEGPFLDPEKKGAHVEENILNPNIDFFNMLNKNSGELIKLVTLAPNMPNALEFINSLNTQVNISLGHTSANYRISKEAFDAGANHVTHLYNAMQPFAHRDSGLIGAAFDSKDVVVELICDGIHVDASVIRATFELFKNRVALISDSMRATGLNDGLYDLGGQEVNVNGKLATLNDGTIAGSVTCLFDCMKKAISFGIPIEEAIASASIIPAKSIGLNDVGKIGVGCKADILIVDKNFNLINVF